MKDFIYSLLDERSITLHAALPLDACRVTRAYLLEHNGISENGTVFIFAVPYLSRFCVNANISAYATAPDYHRFFARLFDELLPLLRERYPEYHFAGFADHSPIDERDAAVSSGLGIIGRNGLLITTPYSSYVFIGEIITDAATGDAPQSKQYCEDCGRCTAACPYMMKDGCLSALTQKKGDLTDDEQKMIVVYGSAWGCDLCQQVCPHTLSAIARGTIYTKIPYFTQSLTPRLTSELVTSMSDPEFAERAYSWRGRETIIRNLRLLEKHAPDQVIDGGSHNEGQNGERGKSTKS